MSYDYDGQIARLTEDPGRIPDEWLGAIGLFQYATRSGRHTFLSGGGCLTMIRREPRRGVPGRDDLAAAIHADDRLPKSKDDIRPEHLPVFKEWQERLDREIRAGNLTNEEEGR